MYLKDVERLDSADGPGGASDELRASSAPVPQLRHLLAFKTAATEHLVRFTQEVMRGPSPLSVAQRELIAAFTSRLDCCRF